ncbi:hypothetical protein O1611_g415 [Lasiodiplodia mahajangana]|uniref:Uncharacterized protein n=1 Tax=Lasiodiplodia mahajangana TaxID=1108764 RepID=A0ACC2K0W9_9PEZI|nr:hypothetical protein O1611_g415 [Lasiodiplodia mahajangana]
MPIGLVGLIGEAIEAATLGAAIGGSVAQYCIKHPHVHGCAKKRDILNLEDVPRMKVENQATGPCDVLQSSFDLCHDQLAGTHVDSSIPGPGKARFDGVPPACMDLAAVLTGNCGAPDGPGVIVCGSACLHYSGLTDEELAILSSTISGK